MRVLVSIGLVLMLCICGLTPAEAQQTNPQAKTISKEPETPPVEVIATENRIKVTNAPIGSKLEIYSVVGIKVTEIEMKESSGEYLVNIAKGYYIVRIGETVRKVAIR